MLTIWFKCDALINRISSTGAQSFLSFDIAYAYIKSKAIQYVTHDAKNWYFMFVGIWTSEEENE